MGVLAVWVVGFRSWALGLVGFEGVSGCRLE